MTCRLRFHLFFSSSRRPECLCIFTGIVVHQLWSSAFSPKHEVIFFFWSNRDGAPPGTWCPTHIHAPIVHIAQIGRQGQFSVGPQRGRGSSPNAPPPPCTPLIMTHKNKSRSFSVSNYTLNWWSVFSSFRGHKEKIWDSLHQCGLRPRGLYRFRYTGFVWHEGMYLMSSFSYLGELSL